MADRTERLDSSATTVQTATPSQTPAAEPSHVKRELRVALRAARDGMEASARAAADAAIAARVQALDAWKASDTVLVYLSFGSEVDTRALISAAWDCGKTVALPRCIPPTRAMSWHRVADFDNLQRSALGILEPTDNENTRIGMQDGKGLLALVPGLAFDRQGYRLGYGGGYYDVFLAAFPGTSIGLCRKALLRPDLRAAGAVDSHDVPVDLVVSA